MIKHCLIYLGLIVASQCNSQVATSSKQGNVYTNINEAINNKDKVYELNILNNNRFQTFPKEILELKNLTVLRFTGSWCDIDSCFNIKSVPKEIRQNKMLEELYLVSNELATVPKEINELKRLKVLDLSENIEIDVSQINSRNLVKLYLNGCKLKVLPENILNLTSLRELGLEDNLFSEEQRIIIQRALPNTKIYF